MKKSIFAKSLVACGISAVMASFGAAAVEPAQVDAVKEQRVVDFNTQFIVTFKDGLAPDMSTKAAQSNIAKMSQDMAAILGQNITHKRAMGIANNHVFKLSEKLDKKQVAAVIKALKGNSNIAAVEEDIMMHPLTNDTYYSNQWHYTESTGGLNVEPAWTKADGSGVVVAVLDTGITNHSDLNANILPGYDMISDNSVGNDGNGRDSDASDPGDWTARNQCGFLSPRTDSSWHGTHVAGTIAAVTNNGKGVAGVAYGAKVVPVRVLGTCGGYTSDIADGIIWASGGSVSGVPANANPAKVINMSLGGGGSCSGVTQSAVNTARANGTVVVVAAGNSDSNANNFTPASCNGVITVASTDRNGGEAYYTNFGAAIDVAAPGGAQSGANDPNGVLSTLNTGTQGPQAESYAFYQGTSMAAPHVAGVAALIFEKWPAATPDDVENILKNTARSFPATCSQCGSGIVDADAAVDAAIAQDGGSGGGGGGGFDVTGSVDNLSIAQGSWKRFSQNLPAGKSDLTISISGGTGDADLYVRYGTRPTKSAYDCRPFLTGNNESCTFPSPQGGAWHVGIFGDSAVSGLTLTYGFNN